ncbi:HI0074 family nucleotidyltransferase substrate-binding subunit [Dyadobacter frigoris]|uniref:Nucleotidyltransferase n=1 Tax=Dyadobacter frigoris TaxID=2576211 RepID=A0A4U6CQ04_9BACT|nr:HI0074 family nucleotidyltransferase substrate-binding subunit [Dyadobacter frigoris]TKT85705.1 nucleotidyltransferase [Dyadobacter frigoris]
MANEDIRWIQRFSNYRKALARLSFAVNLTQERELSRLEEQGLIQAFEFTFDMAWKSILDFIVERRYTGDRDKPIRIIVDAAERNLINEKDWRAMYKSRNKTSHTYDEEIAEDVLKDILRTHFGLLIQLETRLQLEKINQEKNG